jgi:hypothetical protein
VWQRCFGNGAPSSCLLARLRWVMDASPPSRAVARVCSPLEYSSIALTAHIQGDALMHLDSLTQALSIAMAARHPMRTRFSLRCYQAGSELPFRRRRRLGASLHVQMWCGCASRSHAVLCACRCTEASARRTVSRSPSRSWIWTTFRSAHRGCACASCSAVPHALTTHIRCSALVRRRSLAITLPSLAPSIFRVSCATAGPASS